MAFVLNVKTSSDANSFLANGTGIKYTSTLYSVSGRKSSNKKKFVSLCMNGVVPGTPEAACPFCSSTYLKRMIIIMT